MDPGETGRYEGILLDYFLILPEYVVHHILSFLPFKYIVRTSVLSKTWNRIWSHYPNIDLVLDNKVDTNLRYGCPFEVHTQMILDQVLFRKACVEKMRICISCRHMEKFHPIMDQSLRAAIERNVSKLVVKTEYCVNYLFYSIPREVVVADSLKVLQLERCMFGDHNTCIDLPHLRKLKLYMCQFSSENVLSKILCSCPRMELLDVSFCEGMGSFLSIPCKIGLRYLRIKCGGSGRQPKTIKIFAPGLEMFVCKLSIPCSIDLAGCTALKHLELYGAILSDDCVPIQHLLHKYLYIEELKLVGCEGADKIQISSSLLKGLVINNYGRLCGVEINAPNLLSLEYLCLHEWSSNINFCSSKVPKVEEVHMMFSVKKFLSACRSGLKGLLMKLQKYEDLKLLVGWLRTDEGMLEPRGGRGQGSRMWLRRTSSSSISEVGKTWEKKPPPPIPSNQTDPKYQTYLHTADFIMHEKLHAVSFSSLNKLLKKVKPTYVIISSRRDESFLADMVALGKGPKNLSLISSSRRNIEKISPGEPRNAFYTKSTLFSSFKSACRSHRRLSYALKEPSNLETIDKKVTRLDDELLDRFSTLPEPVLHHILSFLPFPHIARCSIWSKTWNRICSSYPNIDLVLHEENYPAKLHRHPFLDYIERILDQCLLRKVWIQKLELKLFPKLVELGPIMDQWLGAAIERNVSELSFELYFDTNTVYSLPVEVVVADSLKVLEIRGCKFEDTCACIDLPRLWKLNTSQCQFASENVLNKILRGCPVLEHVEILNCEGAGTFLSVSCKPRLKHLHIGGLGELERVEIFAASLETFICELNQPCVMDLAHCTHLKHLQLVGAILSDEYVPIQYLLSKLLHTEELHLWNCQATDKIQISSSCLKKLIMSEYKVFPGAEIDTPNLLVLRFFASGACNSNNWFSRWNVPRDFIMHEKLDAVSFSSLNKFLKKEKPYSLSISSAGYESFFPNMIVSGSDNARLFLIFSSRRSIELMHEKLCNASRLKYWYRDFQLVSVEEIEHNMDYDWKLCKNAHSAGYLIAKIILVRRSFEDMFSVNAAS
ncbi:hypothetical protein DM860_009865 [Cuscuta australis]|uniref:F-box domain-containing protein n=1 Tax=Cuscuta australis TaxID=267555 RepID=A0A328DGL6_9ASTE|nr:hypothetical protein DM860_009865 [Cuscuta australis]